MLKKCTALVLLLQASLPAVFGQTSLRGQVVDHSTSEPMPFVSVALYLEANSVALGGSLTDSTGRYVIAGVKPGRTP